MPDSPEKTAEDARLISLEQDHEIRDWTRSFGCTEAELRAAVQAVGHSAAQVRRYLAHRSAA